MFRLAWRWRRLGVVAPALQRSVAQVRDHQDFAQLVVAPAVEAVDADPALVVHPDGGRRGSSCGVPADRRSSSRPWTRLALTPRRPGKMALMISCSDAAARSVVVEYATARSTSLARWPLNSRPVPQPDGAILSPFHMASTNRILGSATLGAGKLEHGLKMAVSRVSGGIRRPENPGDGLKPVQATCAHCRGETVLGFRTRLSPASAGHVVELVDDVGRGRLGGACPPASIPGPIRHRVVIRLVQPVAPETWKAQSLMMSWSAPGGHGDVDSARIVAANDLERRQ